MYKWIYTTALLYFEDILLCQKWNFPLADDQIIDKTVKIDQYYININKDIHIKMNIKKVLSNKY